MGPQIENLSAGEVIALLGLEPHPEGGHYVETYRHHDPAGGRGAVTAIYFLLAAGEVSAWHRVDAVEIWHFYAGAPLRLAIAQGPSVKTVHLGRELAKGERPQAVVPAGAWQSAVSLGTTSHEARPARGWTLVGCTVAPAFRFDGFELAAPGFDPAS